MTEAQTLSYIDKAIKAGKLPKEKLLALYNQSGVTEREPDRLVFHDDDTVSRKPTIWGWEPILPMGKLCHFAGVSGQAKSPVIVDLLARLSAQKEFPDGTQNNLKAIRSLLFCLEDALADIILPRYDLAGGAPGMLRHVGMTQVSKDGTLSERVTAFDKDINLLCDLARKMHAEERGLGAIAIDPITNHLGGANSNAETEIRNILTPLCQLAEELQLILITCGHLNKNSGKGQDPIHRILGAAAFAGVARTIYMFGKDEQSTSPYDHVMTPVRGDMGVAFKYSTYVEEREYEGKKSKVVGVKWNGRTTQTSEQAADPTSKQQVSKERKAGTDLHNFLKSGKRPGEECQKYLSDSGYDLKTLNLARVRRHAGVDTEPNGRKSMWFLPTAIQQFSIPETRQDDAPNY
jgi:AAA domain